MDRLTDRTRNHGIYLTGQNRGATGYVPDDVLKRLAAYEDAEEQGRLVVLPCKVGSDLWSIERARSKCTAHGEEYSEYSCQGCEESCDSVITQRIRRVKEASLMTIASFMQSMCFGKTVFLTRAAAEAALKEGKP